MKSPLVFVTEVLFELPACMHCEPIGSFKEKSYILDIFNIWLYVRYISQLNWKWIAHIAGFFNGFQLYVKLELLRSSYFGSKSWFCYSAYIEINLRFRGRNLYIFQSATVKLKMEMWEIGFTVFLNVHEKITFKN